MPYDYEAAFNKQIELLHEYFVEQMLKQKFKCIYACKEITFGEQFEIEIYPEFQKKEDIPQEGRKKKDNRRAQNNLNDKNSRIYVERLINHNFTSSDIWITLTYSKGNEPKDMEEALKNIQNYMKRINYRRKKLGLPRAKYIYITEHSPEEKIRWHHHVIMDGLLDMDTVESIWKKGRRNETRRIDKDEYGLAGMAIYITKEPNRKKGEKRWKSSKNLIKPPVKKVYNKRKGGTGNYAPVGKYVDDFVRDRGYLEDQVSKWYPQYELLESNIYYNDFNKMFYIKVRMRKNPEGG